MTLIDFMSSKTQSIILSLAVLTVAVVISVTATRRLITQPHPPPSASPPIPLAQKGVSVSQQAAILRGDTVNDLSSFREGAVATVEDLSREVQDLLKDTSPSVIKALQSADKDGGSGFLIKFIAQGSLALMHQKFSNTLLRGGWSLVTGRRTGQASRLEFIKKRERSQIIEIEMTLDEGQNINGLLVIVSINK